MPSPITLPRRKSGHPSTPLTAEETRQWIARETVNKQRERRLQWLYRLLRSFVAAEEAERADAKVNALVDQNRLKQQEVDLKRAEYKRRFLLCPLGVRQMMKENDELKARVAQLEAEIAKTGGSRG